MFHHVKELQFNARVSKPDPRFAGLLLEQFGGGNGELKAAMQYFVQSFAARQPYPDKYDLLMDIATEEFSHLEIVGATITMLLDGINGDLKNAAEQNDLMKLLKGQGRKELIQQAVTMSPQFLVLTGGGPARHQLPGRAVERHYVNANGDLTVDLRSNIAAESRAKIVYEYLMQFTDDPLRQGVAALPDDPRDRPLPDVLRGVGDIQPNFPPGAAGRPALHPRLLQLSDGAARAGPWNEGQGPWETASGTTSTTRSSTSSRPRA